MDYLLMSQIAVLSKERLSNIGITKETNCGRVFQIGICFSFAYNFASEFG